MTLPVVSSVPYVLKPLTASWQPLQVAQALLDDAKAQKLAYLEPAHADVFCALLGGPLPAADVEAWQAWLLAAKEYLYVALCDEELCVPIAEARTLTLNPTLNLSLTLTLTLFLTLTPTVTPTLTLTLTATRLSSRSSVTSGRARSSPSPRSSRRCA